MFGGGVTAADVSVTAAAPACVSPHTHSSRADTCGGQRQPLSRKRGLSIPISGCYPRQSFAHLQSRYLIERHCLSMLDRKGRGAPSVCRVCRQCLCPAAYLHAGLMSGDSSGLWDTTLLMVSVFIGEGEAQAPQ